MTLRSDGALRSVYHREAVLSATPARLLTMLYDRLLLDLRRAEAAQVTEAWETASFELLHAQEIVAELASSLKTDEWDGANGLLALYGFLSTELVAANLERDVEKTRSCIALLSPLHEAWHAAAALVDQPTVHQPGAMQPEPARVG